VAYTLIAGAVSRRATENAEAQPAAG